MASGAIAMIPRGGGTNLLPSDILFPKGRMPEKEPLRQLKNKIYPNIMQ
jgi:hypothetical protein